MGLAVFWWKLKVQDSFFVDIAIVKFVFIDCANLNPSAATKSSFYNCDGDFSVKTMKYN